MPVAKYNYVVFLGVIDGNAHHMPDSGFWDTCRRMAVIGYDAASKLGFCTPTMYAFKGIDIWEGVTSSQMLGLPGIEDDTDWDGVNDIKECETYEN